MPSFEFGKLNLFLCGAGAFKRRRDRAAEDEVEQVEALTRRLGGRDEDLLHLLLGCAPKVE